jgi:hypothetical protein
MLSKLAKIANRLDSLGLTREADVLDSFIRKVAAASEPGHLSPQSTFLKFKKLIDEALMNKSFGMPGDTTDGYVKDFNKLLHYWVNGGQEIGDDEKSGEKKDGYGMSGMPDFQSPIETYNACITKLRITQRTDPTALADEVFPSAPRFGNLVCVPYEGYWCLLPDPAIANKYAYSDVTRYYKCSEDVRLKEQRMVGLCKTIIRADSPPPSDADGVIISCNYTRGILS